MNKLSFQFRDSQCFLQHGNCGFGTVLHHQLFHWAMTLEILTQEEGSLSNAVVDHLHFSFTQRMNFTETNQHLSNILKTALSFKKDVTDDGTNVKARMTHAG